MEAQRNQIIGHARADVSRRHYMHQTVEVDTQSAYLGTTNRGGLIKAAGLMRNKRDPRAPVKFDAEDFKKRQFANRDLSTLIVERNRLVDILKAKCGTITEARTLQPEKYQEYTRLVSRTHGIRRGLERTALKGSRARWFESADHDEIKRQLNGEDASTFTYRKPGFGCPLRSQISDAFSSVEAMMPNKWSKTVRALSVLCAKNRAYTPRRPRAGRTCAYSATMMTSYRLQTGFTRSFHLQPSGSMSARDIYLSRHLPNRSAVHTQLVRLRFAMANT